MSRVEIKKWAKEKINGHIWELFIPIIVAGILTNLTIGQKVTYVDGAIKTESGISLGIFFFFVEVGLTAFMVKFINDQEHDFKDIFAYTKDYVRIFLVGLLEAVFVFLWALLLVIPGIIKILAYALVPMILSDENYNNLGYIEVLKKSEEMMNGHKMDYFILNLSFIGWYILAIFTFGILLIWLEPYHKTAVTKFLYDIKSQYDKPNDTSQTTTDNNVTNDTKYCPNCGSQLSKDSAFCSNCGSQVQ